MSLPSSYVCDTIPAPRLVANPCNEPLNADNDVPEDPPTTFEIPELLIEEPQMSPKSEPVVSERETAPPSRKLCVRHQRMADEGTNLKLQRSLDALPLEEQEAVNALWSSFSSSPHPRRALILQGLLTMCCFSQLSLLTEQLAHLIRIDPFAIIPREVSLKVLGYLDATSLCRAAQVSRLWKSLADDDILWRGICEQHIGQKCAKCGWGLPVLNKKRAYRLQSHSPSASPAPLPPIASSSKRSLDDAPSESNRPTKRQRSERPLTPSLGLPQLHLLRSDSQSSSTSTSTSPSDHDSAFNSLLEPSQPYTLSQSVTRPWKDVYSERLTIERNWRQGRCTVRTLQGHGDGVMCLQFSETLSHPAFPVLITGSYDRTARVWNMETGVELHVLKGHTRAVRALQFDEAKLVTGSMDSTIRVWDWRRGKCIRTLTGHTEGVVCLNFDTNVLASGSEDSTIKVWNLRTGEAFTLRGHSDWVNSVQLWDSNPGATTMSTSTAAVFDSVPTVGSPSSINGCEAPHIDPGKMLFSASDDGTIRLWDLTLRACIRQFTGHVGQVQSIKLLSVEDCGENVGATAGAGALSASLGSAVPPPPASDVSSHTHRSLPYVPPASVASSTESASDQSSTISSSSLPVATQRRMPVLISGSLDNTIKLWDIETGKTVRTFFGHIEGVWSVVSDKLRLVSGSQDRTIKVWNREQGRCTTTLVGHCAAVNCLALGEDKIVSGSDDGDVKIWSFSS